MFEVRRMRCGGAGRVLWTGGDMHAIKVQEQPTETREKRSIRLQAVVGTMYENPLLYRVMESIEIER